jgi:hypothetical protein
VYGRITRETEPILPNVGDPIAEPLGVPKRREYGTQVARTSAPPRWGPVRARLAHADYWWVASSNARGRAHVVAVLGIWNDDRLYWSMAPTTLTARNIRDRGRAVVHLADPRHVAIVEGHASMLRATSSVRLVAAAYRRRFGLRFDPGNRAMRCYVLRPRVARTWVSDDVRATGVRWRFNASGARRP